MTKIRARNEELNVKTGVITAVSKGKVSSESNFPIIHKVDTLTPGFDSVRMWDVFHPLQPMPGGFPLGFFRRARNCSDWNHLIRLTGLAGTCFWVT